MVRVIQDIEIPYKSKIWYQVQETLNLEILPILRNFSDGQNICVLELRLAPNWATRTQFTQSQF